MFCDNCGKKSTTNSNFCDNCGSTVEDIGIDKNNSKERIKKEKPPLNLGIVEFYKKIQKINVTNNTTLLSIAVLIIVGGAFFYFIEGYQRQTAATSQEFADIQQKLEDVQTSTASSLSILSEENEKLKTESDELRIELSKTTSLAKKVPIPSTNELSQQTLKEIMSHVVKVTCYRNDGINTGTGVIQSSPNGSTQWSVYTNLHVVGIGLNAGVCSVGLPQGPDFIPTKIYNSSVTKVAGQYPDIDFAILSVNSTVSFNEFPLKACKVADIKIGDKVTIFGYPSFGGESLTVTDGIVSGVQYTAYGPIYKTSAKIDNGNSGGIAINNDSKCGIGIPTWATSSTFEGLGYIQSWDMIIKSGNL